MPVDKQNVAAMAKDIERRESELMAKADAPEAAVELSPADKRELQGIAHGGETHGAGYGAGPGHPYGDAAQVDGDPKPGDSASKLASAQSTRKSDRARKQGVA